MTEDEHAIREVIDTWMAASITKDTATVLSLMADDVVFLTPGQEPFGKKKFAELQSSMIGTRLEGHADVREVRVCGDMGYSMCYLELAVTPDDGTPTVRRSGHTLTVFKRLANDRWVLARDANLLTTKS
jgi:uncharacterized protein (TIGR02246 family)